MYNILSHVIFIFSGYLEQNIPATGATNVSLLTTLNTRNEETDISALSPLPNLLISQPPKLTLFRLVGAIPARDFLIVGHFTRHRGNVFFPLPCGMLISSFNPPGGNQHSKM